MDKSQDEFAIWIQHQIKLQQEAVNTFQRLLDTHGKRFPHLYWMWQNAMLALSVYAQIGDIYMVHSAYRRAKDMGGTAQFLTEMQNITGPDELLAALKRFMEDKSEDV